MDVGDIVERETKDTPVKPPGPPSGRLSRRTKESRWKQTKVRTGQVAGYADNDPRLQASTIRDAFGDNMSEEERIHLENLKRLSSMESEEIEKERQQLIAGMDQGVLEALLRRAIVKDEERGVVPQTVEQHAAAGKQAAALKDDSDQTLPSTTLFGGDPDPSLADNAQEPQAGPASADVEAKPLPDNSLHFPKPLPTTELETEEDFLSHMHEKFFPELEVESGKLAWMRPIDADSEEAAEYRADQESLAPSEIRFDFRGNLVTPNQSRQIDPHLGLHHHGDAPLAAGYTIGELGHLARSTHQSQRCMAIQTLGRILFKMPKIKSSELRAGLQGCVDQFRILESLHEAAGQDNTISVQAYATEALWYYNQAKSRTAV